VITSKEKSPATCVTFNLLLTAAGCLMVTAAFNGGSDGQQQGIDKAGGRQVTRQEGMVDDMGQAGGRQHGERGGLGCHGSRSNGYSCGCQITCDHGEKK
jgi:hypothetical protein